jgi:hypothetical protein
MIQLMELVIRLNAVTFQQSETHLRSNHMFHVNIGQGRYCGNSTKPRDSQLQVYKR